VDEWIAAFRQVLEMGWGLTTLQTPFIIQPTYDIDIAFAHAHRGLARTAGNFLTDILKGDPDTLRSRFRTLAGLQPDPYDSFQTIFELHKGKPVKPLFFVLAAAKTTEFDKNINPCKRAMVHLIREMAENGVVGVHPSYYSGIGGTLVAEKETLERITGSSIRYSRQHYIKLTIPDTYYQLLDAGITEDFSMGYSSVAGFRAGTGSSFPWYDLSSENATALTVHPFCYMDTMMRFEQGKNATESFAVLHEISQRLERAGSTLITIFHNFSLGTDKGWRGWKDGYELFLQSHQ
jgi:hypothetical protein